MSRQQEQNVTSRTNDDAPLRDTPYELLEKARQMLLHAAELYHKEGNPTETEVFHIIAKLSSVMSTAQERASYYNHPQHQSPNCINLSPSYSKRPDHFQQYCATSVTGPSLTKRVKKGVASRAPLNSKDVQQIATKSTKQKVSPECSSNRVRFTKDSAPDQDEQILMDDLGEKSSPLLEINKKSRFLDEKSSIYTDDSDKSLDKEPHQRVVTNLGAVAKKKTLSAKSKLATSRNYNDSSHSDLSYRDSASNTNATNGSNSKKKRKQKEETKAKILKGQRSKSIRNQPFNTAPSTEISKESCLDRNKNCDKCPHTVDKQNLTSVQPPPGAKDEFREDNYTSLNSCNQIQMDPARKNLIIIDDSDDEDFADFADFAECGSLLRAKDEQNHFENHDKRFPNERCLLSLRNFQAFWWKCVTDMGFNNTADLENQSSIREASTKCKKFQYGRTEFDACQKIFDLTNLKRSDLFLDIGHGIGNAVIQAAVTIGCKSRGLELIEERYKVSCDFRNKFLKFINLEREKNNQEILMGDIELCKGDFCDKAYQSFITEADVVLVNNAMEIFSGRSQSPENIASLDDHIAGLFAKMKPGAQMVTFSSLPLGLSLTDANNKRKMKDKPSDDDASFFECRAVDLGNESVSWTNKSISVYIYRRVQNSRNSSVFICDNCGVTCNVLCECTGLLIKTCVYCHSKRPVTGVREATKGVQYNQDDVEQCC